MIKRHGLSIGIERTGQHFFLSLKTQGKLTHEDYETITPMIDSALEGVKEPKVKALIDCIEFEGWEPRAAWDDFKLGLKHRNEFERIAIVGNQSWLEKSARIAGWFVSGEVRYFESADDAINWLSE